MSDHRQSLPLGVVSRAEGVRHLHSSGLNSVPASRFRKALLWWVKRHHPDVITVTEVQHARRAAALRAPAGFDYFRGRGPGANQCAVLWRSTGFPGPTVRKVSPITDETYWTKGGKRRPFVHATTVVLTDRRGTPLLVSVAHYPPSIEGKAGLTGLPRRVATAVSAVAGHRAHVRQVARDYRALTGTRVRRRIVVADWNVDARKRWVRSWLRANWPGYLITWRRPFPRLGTLGRTRLIDTALVRGLRVSRSPRLLSREESASDHRAFVYTAFPRGGA